MYRKKKIVNKQKKQPIKYYLKKILEQLNGKFSSTLSKIFKSGKDLY